MAEGNGCRYLDFPLVTPGRKGVIGTMALQVRCGIERTAATTEATGMKCPITENKRIRATVRYAVPSGCGPSLTISMEEGSWKIREQKLPSLSYYPPETSSHLYHINLHLHSRANKHLSRPTITHTQWRRRRSNHTGEKCAHKVQEAAAGCTKCQKPHQDTQSARNRSRMHEVPEVAAGSKKWGHEGSEYSTYTHYALNNAYIRREAQQGARRLRIFNIYAQRTY